MLFRCICKGLECECDYLQYLHRSTFLKCGYYPQSVHEVMIILNYYLNLYARLNNVVITTCKLK
jgi:hypothetical protein